MKVNNTMKFGPIRAKTRTAVEIFGRTSALKMEGTAKDQAPWVDRTTNARNSIQGDFKWQGNKAIISLSGNMEYSVYLELAMEKRFAVLVPTIKHYSNDILNGYRKVVFAGV